MPARPTAPAIRLHLFGVPRIDAGEGAQALPFERRHQLVVLLALKRGWVGRAELATMFWPELDAKLAGANVRKILFRLQALPWAQGVESEGGAVRFVAATDVAEFDAALREGRFADALPLYTDEFLRGFDDGQSEAWTGWLNFERDRLRTAWRSAALDHLDGDLDPGAGVELSARLLDADPLDEAALRAHMQWLARHGHTARARQAYQAFVARLSDELGLTPGAELRAAHDALGAAAVAATAIARPAAAVVDDGFVGRSLELRRIAELLAQDQCQLVSVVGPGGMGKTRFARRVQQELAARFADGTVFVPLEDVTAAELPRALAREMGVTVTGGAEPLAKVIDYAKSRAMLLVLDNFEQLASEGAVLERLLEACPRVKLIVTSRVRVAVAGEWLLRLDGLPCPEPGDEDDFEAFDATRLFVNAARRVEPGLSPQAEAADIVAICRHVEGMPLALELAAAWTRVLSCAEIAAELGRSAELLAAPDAAHPARHASIEAVFDQSWRLLTPVERDALARLSVFRGGFTGSAARAVVGAAPPVLGALADKSLLRKDEQRLHLHPLVREFAAARLDAAARAAAQSAHAQYFHRLMVQLRRDVESGDREAMRQMDAEFENCREAWQWAIAHAAIPILLAGEAMLLSYCDHRSRHDEGMALAQAALGTPACDADPVLAARILGRIAHTQYRLDRHDEAAATAQRALEMATAARDYSAKLHCHTVLGSSSLRRARYDDALRNYRAALELATARDDVHGTAVALDHIALVEKVLGHYDEAIRMALQSLAAHRRLGDFAGEALCLNNVATSLMASGEFEAAGAYLREGLALCDRHALSSTRVYMLANLTDIAIKAGDVAAAEGYAKRGIETAMAAGNRAVVAWMKLQYVRLALLHGDLPAARACLAESLAISVPLGLTPLKTGAVMVFGEVLLGQGETMHGRQLFLYLLDHPATSVPDRDEIRAHLAQLPPADGAVPPWAGPDLEPLIDRIVGEADVAYAPLLASLRGAAPATSG